MRLFLTFLLALNGCVTISKHFQFNVQQDSNLQLSISLQINNTNFFVHFIQLSVTEASQNRIDGLAVFAAKDGEMRQQGI